MVKKWELFLGATVSLQSIIPLSLLASAEKQIFASSRVEELLSQMTLLEKIGQMTQPNRKAIDRHPEDLYDFGIGSLLSGGDDVPHPNTPANWLHTVEHYQHLAHRSRLQIPLLYGVDAVHGHALVHGAVVFPHNIGLGATGNEALVQRIGEATARVVAATGIHWSFAPAVSVPQDVRWGRTYEGFSDDPLLVDRMGAAMVRGLQGPYREGEPLIGATLKHFVGDGGTQWGTSRHSDYKIDQGNTPVDDDTIRRIHLRAYEGGLREGVMSVMVSYSRIREMYMHSHRYWITDVLKGELGFNGVVVSDWLGVFWQPGTVEDKIAASLQAGIDLVMAVDQYDVFIQTAMQLVETGRVPMGRIDDAVRRILSMKEKLGLLPGDSRKIPSLDAVGSDADRLLARQAVRESAVLLKNNDALPLRGETGSILLLGEAAHNIGKQCGGWTLRWQGVSGNSIPGTSIFQGLKENLKAGWALSYHSHSIPADQKRMDHAIVVIAEEPYAEGYGDREDLHLTEEQRQLMLLGHQHAHRTILIVLSGRPLLLDPATVENADAIIAAWLPGSEGGSGLAELLLGQAPFTGRLPFRWSLN